jgi:hypothetical protein
MGKIFGRRRILGSGTWGVLRWVGGCLCGGEGGGCVCLCLCVCVVFVGEEKGAGWAFSHL